MSVFFGVSLSTINLIMYLTAYTQSLRLDILCSCHLQVKENTGMKCYQK